MESKLVNKVEPVYPRRAEAAHLRGVVLLDVLIAPDGRVAGVHLWQGDPALAPAAVDAVQQWTYKPTLIGGRPVEVVTLVRVPFGTQ